MIATPPAVPATNAPPDPHLYKIRDLIYRAAGIFHPDNKLRLLEDRCSRRLQELGVKTFREYLERLSHQTSGREEMVKLLNEITIGETCFFRNRTQLDALRSVVLPRILANRSAALPKKLRFWSAGCSTGEEPYTLAMFLAEECALLLKGWSFEIQATDLNEHSLAHAHAGVYGDYSVRNVNTHYRQRYFVPVENQLRIGPEARKTITFSRLNLLDAPHMALMRNMDVIFCANVLIYFDLQSKRSAIEQFHSSLQPHGYLFLGHSESLYGVTDKFKLVHFPSATGYAKALPTTGS
ncbi:MAG TPA: protein-glutamate O-methyltransferase CheR [Terriglobales bacterium]|nr:protein-glutamate O-methyltransferase CheR [Terriglobales bacterium]